MSNYRNESCSKYKAQFEDCNKNDIKNNIKMVSNIKMTESFLDSQNFCLKLSQDSNISDINISDTQNINDADVIIMSDSSSKSTCSIPKYVLGSTSNNHPTIDNTIYIEDSSDSDSIDITNEKYFQSWRANKKSYFINSFQERKDIINKNNIYMSDDFSSSSSGQEYITTSKRTNSSNSYITCTRENRINDISETNIQCNTNTDISNLKNSNSITQPPKTTPHINSGLKKKISKEDTKNIIKNIKSTRIIYESPKIQKEKNVISNKEIDNNIIHPAISPKNNLKTNDIFINETQIDSESDIIQDSQVNLTHSYKTRVNKFLNTPCIKKDTSIKLSERKRKQISQWLMTNLPDSQSDSSLDIVPLTNKHDKSSGNSSLERLEMNYETPNNRGKINQLPISENKIINSKCNKTSNPTVLHQTITNEFVQKTKNNELHTSHETHTNNNKFSTPINTPTNTSQNIDIKDCADILDKLYGKSWRNKADILFPKSESRMISTIKQATITKNRAVQTERRIINRERLYISDSDSSNTSLKDLKLQNRSKKKNVRKNIKRKDDTFINDQTSSESENESLYYTALTNPRESQNSTQSKTVLPSIVQRAIKICDTDSEDNDNIDNNNQIFNNIRGRKLSFNESEDSSTSEFDPGDEIPPKSTIKKDFIKTVQIPKLKTQNKLTSDNPNYKKHNSFLASLSENVSLTNVHPDAKKYRLDYKNNKENLCKYLYKLYNEKVFDNELPEDMSIEWNVRMRGTAGFCYNKKSVKTLGGIVKSSRIVLATKILDTPDRLRDTLIHEMCHAAAWLINGISDGHGPFWTKWANKAMKIFPELPPIRRCHDYKIKTKFTYKCINCGYSIGRHSKSLDIEKKRCGHCYGKFELLLNKTTKSGTVQMQTPKREPSAFALYVKENYNSVKKERNIGHGAVMKLLGQQFSAIKIAKKQENIENNPNIIN